MFVIITTNICTHIFLYAFSLYIYTYVVLYIRAEGASCASRELYDFSSFRYEHLVRARSTGEARRIFEAPVREEELVDPRPGVISQERHRIEEDVVLLH